MASHDAHDSAPVPPWRGRPASEGVPRSRGVPPGVGKPPGAGIPKDTGRLPEEGSIVKGAPGQTDRGAPGQMDPGTENPWAGEQGLDGTWGTPTAPSPETVDPFATQHPNFFGVKDDGDPKP